MVGVARAEDLVDHADGRERAQLRVAQLRVDGQRVLDALQLRRQFLQLGRLALLADADERLVRGFLVEPVVRVDLVRPDGRLDGRVQLHPCHVALVIVVGEERLGARLEEALERRLVGQPGCLAQETRRLAQLGLVLDAVGDDGECPVACPADDGEEAGGCVALGAGKRLLPLLHLLLRRVRRIEVGRLRPGRNAGDERRVVVEVRPGPLVDEEELQARAAQRARVLREIEEELPVSRPCLAQVDGVHQPRGADDLRQGGALAVRKRAQIGRHLGGRETRRHLPQSSLVHVRLGSEQQGDEEHGARLPES